MVSLLNQMQRHARRRRWAIFWALCALAVAALVWLYLRPEGAEGMPCLVHWTTGWYCPGCGFTRALHLLLHGRLYAAFRMNPLAISLLPVLVWLCVAQAVQWLTGRDVLPKIPNAAVYALIAVVLLYTVARNLPMAPFVWLRPTRV